MITIILIQNDSLSSIMNANTFPIINKSLECIGGWEIKDCIACALNTHKMPN